MSYSICSHIHICTICRCVSVCVPNSIASTGNSFCIFDIECIIDNPSSWPPLLKGTPVEPARSSLCLSFATSFLASFICAHATAYFNSPLVLSLPTVQTKHSQQQQLLTCACVCACACASCYGKLVLNALLPPVPPPPPLSLSLPWSFGTRRRMPYEWFKCMFCAQKIQNKRKTWWRKTTVKSCCAFCFDSFAFCRNN